MKKILSIVMVLCGAQIFYASNADNSVNYTLLQLASKIAIKQLKEYEQLCAAENSSISAETKESINRVMIYSSSDIFDNYNSLNAVLDLQRSKTLAHTKRFKKSGMSQEAYVDVRVKEFRDDLILCEKQLAILAKTYPITK